jgi:8-oxo-dGTP pyrophosphatase MutT (NUDIX family)
MRAGSGSEGEGRRSVDITTGDQPIRPASTVMLLRDGDAGLEVFTLRRVAAMAFAGGMTAFPGGGVDPTDGDPGIPWAGPGPDWWAGQWSIDADRARRQVVAAVRELFEETGILLAGPDDDPTAVVPELTVSDVTVPDVTVPDATASGSAAVSDEVVAREDGRLAVAAHRESLAAALRRWDRPLRADLLRPWARWITPPGQSRRYDTYFFVAALPAGQQAAAVTSEAAAGGWQRPQDALDAERAGAIGMMPPTIAMMTDLARAASVADVLAAPRQVRPVTPVVLSADGEVLRVLADGRELTARMPRRTENP